MVLPVQQVLLVLKEIGVSPEQLVLKVFQVLLLHKVLLVLPVLQDLRVI